MAIQTNIPLGSMAEQPEQYWLRLQLNSDRKRKACKMANTTNLNSKLPGMKLKGKRYDVAYVDCTHKWASRSAHF
ncbi:hypothetical protein PABG_07071 [Paracoccidioides brasiliensis Pb03]|nr:hypothetical protein PABG_07071 [Paracoccidioides brasiliensis Pb03]